MHRLISLIALLLLLPWATTTAQVPPEENMLFEVSLVGAVPRGEFEDNVDEVGVGFSTFFGGRVPGLPFALGTELGWTNFSTQNRFELIGVQPPLSAVNVEASRNILAGHLVARFTPPTGPVRPYIDGLVGVKYFLSRARIQADVEPDIIIGAGGVGVIVDDERDRISVASSFNDLVFSAGVGAGLEFSLYHGTLGLRGRRATVSVTMGARYLFGPEARLLGDESIPVEAERIFIEGIRSRTDMIVPHLGLRVDV